ncbi:MAG: putative Glutamyl-tRNA(Gln) amidotransferase subunit [Solirubrobacterales bacterium]|nr:putative Glutamyl-tRNA(Gln) amidotransferase subunit [Solirubrobacterales bacterium]
MSDMRTWSVAEVAGAIRRGETTCAEVTQARLEQARRVDPELACFIELEAEAAMERAHALDAQADERDRPMFGVPFAHKDVFVGDRFTPSAGSRNVPIHMRGRTSPMLDRLADAGAISLGRLNLDQFGYAATGANPDFGHTRNPWDTDRIAGGSSSGAAAAVATGVVPFAIGSDTGGSVRIPASFCGVVGLKPTFGRLPKRGAVAMSYSQDTLGILARSVKDAAIVLEAAAGHDPLDPSSFDVPAPAFARDLAGESGRLDGVRLGVDRAQLAATTGQDVHAAVETAIGVLEGLGARVVEIDLACLARYDIAATVLTWAEIGAVHGSTFARRRADYAPATRSRLETTLASRGADHVDALRYQGRALLEFRDRILSHVDVVVTATTGRSPETVAAVVDGAEEGVPVSLAALRLNRPFNFLGLPSMSVPIGFASDGLPMGLQLVTRPWAEGRLLACGAAYQTVTDWHRLMPPMADRGAGGTKARQP